MAAEFCPQQEHRIALVLYGGVSLAIYMYGVVEELHHLVRSTAPKESYAKSGDPPRELLFEEPESTEAVYRKLGQLLPLGEQPSNPDLVRTRFVVDIISGTSAGGINGICLAKALVNEAKLDGLKDVWLDHGGIGDLINDRDRPPGPPASLLSGPLMTENLVSALAGMDLVGDRGDARSPLVDELDLWVTATDLDGLEVPIRVANVETSERRHANRYRFHYPSEGGEYDDDFGPKTNPFMAYAARSTSAFPFAFDPAVLDDLKGYASGDWGRRLQSWRRRFFSIFDSARTPFEQRSFSDGGILDNKPFTYATDSLLGRRAVMHVERSLVYVEPDPKVRTADHEGRWNPAQTSQAAILGIPHVETIREDIDAVLARNREIRRAREVTSDLPPIPMPSPRRWETSDFSDEEVPDEVSAAYEIYRRLKVNGVVDWLAGLVATGMNLDPRSDRNLAVHHIVDAWREERFKAEREADNAFLLKYDSPYRVRRLDFVLLRLKDRVDGSDRELDAAARAVRVGLHDARSRLTEIEREFARGDWNDALGDLRIAEADLDEILDRVSDEEMRKAADELVKKRKDDFKDLSAALETRLHEASRTAIERVNATLGPQGELTPLLRPFYDNFEAHDLALYPVQFGTAAGETNAVNIVRISPSDAYGPKRPPGRQRPALKGAGLGHFAAFLDRDWRREDMAWGRIDAAECLIKALLPEEHEQREALIEEAHRRIVAEYAAEKTDGDPDEWFWRSGRVPDQPDRAETYKSVARGELVIGEMVEGDGRGVRTFVKPVVEAIQPDVTPMSGVGQVLNAAFQQRKFVWIVRLWATVLVGLVAVALLVHDEWFRIPAAIVACLLALVGAGLFAALYYGLRWLGPFINKRIDRILFRQD